MLSDFEVRALLERRISEKEKKLNEYEEKIKKLNKRIERIEERAQLKQKYWYDRWKDSDEMLQECIRKSNELHKKNNI